MFSQSTEKFAFGLALALILVGCAAPGPAPLALPPGQAVRLVIPSDRVNVQVFIINGAIGSSLIAQLYGDGVNDANQSNTAKLRSEVALRQKTEPLTRLFENEVRARIVAKGGRLSPPSDTSPSSPTITLDNLSTIYSASTPASAYKPTAFVYVSASTDPANIGNKPGATVRHIEVNLAQPDLWFASSASLFSNPAKAYSGLRGGVVALAERVATLIVAAQVAGRSQ